MKLNIQSDHRGIISSTDSVRIDNEYVRLGKCLAGEDITRLADGTVRPDDSIVIRSYLSAYQPSIDGGMSVVIHCNYTNNT